ncbi:MAG: hypothetical protein AABW87_02685 [Nanoarchaeota archaeon]
MIAGFGFTNISVERKNPVKGKVEIKYNLNINDIEEEKLPLLGPGKISLRMDFKYSVDYEPKIGSVKIAGNMIYVTDSEAGKKLLSEWKKNKRLGNEEVAAVIFNTALTRCNIRALALSQDVGLPPHLPLPKAIPKGSAKSYIG